ncbi:MAG: hypothetical protein Q9O24_09820 [Gammaproteobacteria bacterium]|nr:hypothetical protein [Gammaproteobacteria bacterium]
MKTAVQTKHQSTINPTIIRYSLKLLRKVDESRQKLAFIGYRNGLKSSRMQGTKEGKLMAITADESKIRTHKSNNFIS